MSHSLAAAGFADLMVRQAHHEEESKALILSLSKDEPFLGSRRFRDLMVRQAHHEDGTGMIRMAGHDGTLRSGLG